jgi:hypothetical protein
MLLSMMLLLMIASGVAVYAYKSPGQIQVNSSTKYFEYTETMMVMMLMVIDHID